MPKNAPSQAPSTEDTFMAVLLALGPALRQRLPGDEFDYSVLPVLADLDRSGASRLAEIADRLRLDASTISRRVKDLHHHDLVSTTTDADDARARRVHITPAGRGVLKHLIDQRRGLLSQVISDWTVEDRDRLGHLLDRFLDDLATPTETPAPTDTPARNTP